MTRRLHQLVSAAIIAAILPLSGCYLSRAAWEEGRILLRRRPIAQVIRDDDVDPVTRGKLQLVVAARAYAADSLGLKAGGSFTTFTDVGRDTLVLVLSASERDRLRSYTWSFPIVGRVPYKGFFDFGAARSEARKLQREGYDIYMRPSDAFSTLGWFDDPLLSTTLVRDSIDLANTIIHEVTHNTFFAKGQVVFNESFANFVGHRGAGAFFRSRGAEAAAAEVADHWRDELLLSRFWSDLRRSVDSALSGAAPSPSRIAARDSVYAAARRRLVAEIGPQLRTFSSSYAERVPLNNAYLLARQVYGHELGIFDEVMVVEEGDLRRTIRRVIDLAQSRPADPFGAIREFVSRAQRR